MKWIMVRIGITVLIVLCLAIGFVRFVSIWFAKKIISGCRRLKTKFGGEEMKKFLFSVLLVIISFPAWAEPNPEKILALALDNYSSVSSEIEYSTATTSDWGKSPRYCTSWVRRHAGGEDELLFVINRSDELRPKPDGAIIKSEGGLIIPPVIFQKRRSIREKSSDFDEKSNGTEVNYFDLARMAGEYVKNLDVSFWYANSGVQAQVKHSIRATPKLAQPGDYAFRVFHIGEVDGVMVILAVECFNGSDQIVKLQLNFDFEKLEINGRTIMREKSRQVIGENSQTTVITVKKRIFNADFGALDEKALERGQP